MVPNYNWPSCSSLCLFYFSYVLSGLGRGFKIQSLNEFIQWHSDCLVLFPFYFLIVSSTRISHHCVPNNSKVNNFFHIYHIYLYWIVALFLLFVQLFPNSLQWSLIYTTLNILVSPAIIFSSRFNHFAGQLWISSSNKRRI